MHQNLGNFRARKSTGVVNNFSENNHAIIHIVFGLGAHHAIFCCPPRAYCKKKTGISYRHHIFEALQAGLIRFVDFKINYTSNETDLACMEQRCPMSRALTFVIDDG